MILTILYSKNRIFWNIMKVIWTAFYIHLRINMIIQDPLSLGVGQIMLLVGVILNCMIIGKELFYQEHTRLLLITRDIRLCLKKFMILWVKESVRLIFILHSILIPAMEIISPIVPIHFPKVGVNNLRLRQCLVWVTMWLILASITAILHSWEITVCIQQEFQLIQRNVSKFTWHFI